jgi:transposase-like protein
MTLKLQNLAKRHKPNTTWSQEARIQAVSQYLVLGNMALVSSITKIPHQLLRAWKQQSWWDEIASQVRATENLQMDNKLSKIVDKSLDAVLDRVENGEYVYNVKTGTIIRKPVNMKDVAKVSTDMITKRELLRGNATERTEQSSVSVADQLKALALEFAKWAPQGQIKQQTTIDVESVEIVSEDTEEDDDAVPDEWETRLQEGAQLGEDESPESSEGQSGEECSAFYNGEGWQSPQG